MCESCLDRFGSCNLFQTYDPSVSHLKKPALGSTCLDVNNPEENDESNNNEFILPGSVCTMLSDSKDTESFWLISIVAIRETADDIVDDYRHHVQRNQQYIECHYLEKDDKTKKGHIYRMDSKIAFVFKECIIYPFVNIKQSGSKYILSDEDYCEVLRYIEHSGFSHL